MFHSNTWASLGLGPASDDKENVRSGMPVVKGSDVLRVKRNLAGQALRPKNSFGPITQSPSTNILSANGRCINSPVTELAHNFTELAAHENTPKRRLSLTSSGSPTPDNFCKSIAYSRCPSSASDKSTCSGFASPAPKMSEKGGLEEKLSQNSAFRRYNSVPYGHHSNEASPQLNYPVPKSAVSAVSPLATASKTAFFLGGESLSPDSQDSGIGKDEPFQFIAPSVPPQKTRQQNELSPCHRQPTSALSRVIGSPDFSDYTAQDHTDSPLLAHTLCSEDADDGFLDFDHLENQEFGDVPDNIVPMLTGKLTVEEEPSIQKRNLFRSPSMPGGLSKKSTSFDIRRRVVCFKRPEPPKDSNTPVSNKRRRAIQSDGDMKVPNIDPKISTFNAARLQRCKSMVEHSASFALTKSDSDADLTGDFTKPCCLPTVRGKHQDLKCITPETMANILRKDYDHVLEQYTVIDCRYPYEYEGGHIKDAENIYIKDDIYKKFLAPKPGVTIPGEKRSILIFHCEFSSERAPKLSRFLRNNDRSENQDNYPNLCYPEIYLLEGGYKAFYEAYPELCVPDTYKPMLHKDHSDDLKTFRAKSKSWAGGEKRGFRPGLKW